MLTGAAGKAQPLAQHRRPTTEEQADKGDDGTFIRGSNSQTYLLRRLARDAPEVLERVKAGEFRSARAAAIEAGIIRPVPTIRLVDDPAKVAAAIRKHLSPEHRPASDPERKVDNVNLKQIGPGNSAAYLAARLKKAGRDDLLEQIGPGKPHRSVRSAAIEAGIIKPVPTIRLVDDPAKVAAALRKHLSPKPGHRSRMRWPGGRPSIGRMEPSPGKEGGLPMEVSLPTVMSATTPKPEASAAGW